MEEEGEREGRGRGEREEGEERERERGRKWEARWEGREGERGSERGSYRMSAERYVALQPPKIYCTFNFKILPAFIPNLYHLTESKGHQISPWRRGSQYPVENNLWFFQEQMKPSPQRPLLTLDKGWWRW